MAVPLPESCRRLGIAARLFSGFVHAPAPEAISPVAGPATGPEGLLPTLAVDVQINRLSNTEGGLISTEGELNRPEPRRVKNARSKSGDRASMMHRRMEE
jgi:hypothetical protein